MSPCGEVAALIASSPTAVGLLALVLAVPCWAAIGVGTYRLIRPTLERLTGVSADAPPRSRSLTAVQLILLGLGGLLLTGTLATVLLATT